ncbi:MAG TPA: hypothetical protein VN132_03675, partial [Bdellovibrio sp.]|nr:hypothetical protein [Bdellovibrio sp.]
FLKAEILFVKASYFAQTSQHSFAASNFHKASEFYAQTQDREKEALSRFNHFIAESYILKSTLAEENQKLQLIVSHCQQHQVPKIEFLCHRHRSFRLYESAQYQEAIDCLITWIARTDALTRSDSHLALLHIADCFLELRDVRKAIFYCDQVPTQIDERVRFAKAYVDAKISGHGLDIQNFPLVPSHWKQRYEKSHLKKTSDLTAKSSESLCWNLKTGLLTLNKSLKGKFKAQSLEGQLLRLLMDASRSKSHLCESLWPSEMETAFLDDRFHQLVQRINRKSKNLIVFDGQFYRLSSAIHLKSV